LGGCCEGPQWVEFDCSGQSDSAAAALWRNSPATRLSGISHTVAGAGLGIVAPLGFRTLVTYPLGEYTRYWRRRENLLARQCPTLRWAIIPRQCEKSGLAISNSQVASFLCIPCCSSLLMYLLVLWHEGFGRLLLL
jgi:hypothetical protein